MYAFFSSLKRLWTGIGSPCAGFMRFVRHGMLGRMWPADRVQHSSEPALKSRHPHPAGTDADIAVIIPCHNYARFLSRAIESILQQTVRPCMILVVDDASTDNTKDIALRFAAQGVRYLRVENNSLSLTRNSGAAATQSAYLLFLDADDHLSADYLEKCMEQMTGPEVAIVYTDRQQFGDNAYYMKTPEYDYAQLTQGNYISSHALIQRQAFDVTGGYRQVDHSLEDWDFYRRVLRLPYIAKRAESLVYYNVHKDSMLQTLVRGPHWSYANEAALPQHPVTIFTPFAGREDIFERYVAGLRTLLCDPAMIHLHWYDTSDNPTFEKRLRETLGTLPFGRTIYTQAPLPEIWRQTPASLIRNRIGKLAETEYHYQLAVVRAYNEMITTCDTEYALVLEDDMRLEPDTLLLLQRSMQRNTAAVCAPYKSGFYPRYEIWNADGNRTIHFTEKGTGIHEVGGSGFGCTLFRTSMLRTIAPISTGVRETPKQWYDQRTYLRLATQGRVLCNWNAEVEHMKTERHAETLSSDFE